MEAAAILLFLIALIAWRFGRLIFRPQRRWKPWRDAPDLTDATQQLSFVSRVSFERQPLLNKAEFQVLLILEAVVRDMKAGHRVMAQTSLGEILRPKSPSYGQTDSDLAYRSINSKRADFVIVDRRGLAVLAVEYHGHGHYQGNAHLRDAVKREAFRSAGVQLLEIYAFFEKEEVARQVRKFLSETERTPGSGAIAIGQNGTPTSA
jgi:hypothetical protein